MLDSTDRLDILNGSLLVNVTKQKMKKDRNHKWRTAEKIILGVGTIGLVAIMLGYSFILYFRILAEVVSMIIN